jgi:GT2 family glycosyltransferase
MNPQDRRLRAVLVNWNGGPLLERAVDSLLAAEWPGPIDVVVVDNASTDRSVDRVATRPGVHVLQRSTNEGFGANNHGIADLLGRGPVAGLVEPDAVVLLNPDATVRPDALLRMAEALDVEQMIGAVAPQIVFDRPFVDLAVTEGDVTITAVRSGATEVTSQCHGAGGAFRLPGPEQPIWRCGAGSRLRVPAPDGDDAVHLTLGAASSGRIAGTSADGAGTIRIELAGAPRVSLIQNAGSRIGERGVGENRAFAEPTDAGAPADVSPAWCGAAVMLAADYLRDVGGFEPSYFLYYEDIDLSLRGLARGWATAYRHDAVVEHRHSDRATQGTRQVEVLQHRNRLVMLARNAPLAEAAQAFGLAVLTPVSLLVSSVRSGDGAARRRLAGWRLRSVVAAVRMLGGALRGRRALSATRRLTPAEVFARATER